MATIVTRSGKGSSLTHTEVDANFTNLNADKLELAGGTMSGDLAFGDSDKAIFGAGSDLQIYHDGSNSYVTDTGTGDLIIDSNGNAIRLKGTNGENMIVADTDASAKLFYNGSQKLATTSTGVNVTGTITVTGTVDGRDVATDGTKLDGIEAGATADQTAAQLLTAIKTVDGVDSGLDADLLDGLHESTFMRRSANSGLDMNNNNITDVEDIYLQDKIYHDGDTDTYMQFHAGNQWRVVTGGSERFEVNNTQITSTEPVHAPSFHGDGSGLTGAGGLQFISTIDLASDAYAVFTGFDGSKYDSYKFVYSNVIPSVDGALDFQFSSNGGVSYDTGSSDYKYLRMAVVQDVSTVQKSYAVAGMIRTIAYAIGSAANEHGSSGEVNIYGAHLAKRTLVSSTQTGLSNVGSLMGTNVFALRNSAVANNAIRFFPSSGNLESGTITMYGMVNS